MTRRFWTPDEDARLRALFPANPLAAVAAALGRTACAVKRRCDYLGLHSYKRLSPDERTRAEEMIRAGRADSEIARALGRPCGHAVRRIRHHLGVVALDRRSANVRAWVARKASVNPHAPTPAERRTLEALEQGPGNTTVLTRRIGRGSTKNTVHRLDSLHRKGLAFAEGAPGHRKTWYSVAWWLEHNRGLVHGAALRVWKKNRWCELEDVTAELTAAILKAVPSFEPRGVKFATFGVLSAERRTLVWAAGQRCAGVKLPTGSGRFDVSVFTARHTSFVADDGDREIEIEARDHSDAPPVDPAFWERAVAGLSKLEARIVLAHFRDGMTYTEIGQRYCNGLSKGAVRQRMDRAIQKVRDGKALDDYAA